MKTSSRVSFIRLLVCLFPGFAWAGTIMEGPPRPPISPDRVKVYWEQPRHFDRIAIITKGSGGSWMFSDEGQVDEAIAKIKVEAARLGANGIVLQVVEERSGGGVGIGIGGLGFPGRHVAIGGGTSFYAPIIHKRVQAEAIYVRR